MEFDLNKESVKINKQVANKKELVFVEEDMIVPDSKPDILKTVNLSGNVCIYKKEVLDGKIKIDGCINTYIMYIPDNGEENLRGLTAIIDFSQNISIPECKEEMDAKINTYIKDLECKIINGRKINIRVGLDINMNIYSNEEIEVISNVNNMDEIETLNETLTINSLIGKNSTRVYIKDSLNIDNEDEIAEILKAQINLTDSDVKISYNKVLSKCEVEVKILYLTERGDIKSLQGKIPAVGFIDMQNISEDNICDITNEIKNILIKPNVAEEHSIYVELEIETICIAYEKKQISLIQDLYSPINNIDFTQKRINISTERTTQNKEFTVTSKINIPEISDGKLIDTEVIATINKEQISQLKINYEGELLVNFIFENSNKIVGSKFSKIPFDFYIDNPFQSDNINIDSSINIVNKSFEVKSNGDIDCNMDLECQTELSKNVSMNIIDNIRIGEKISGAGDYDSLIIYIVQKEDTLWKIAKKFRSTINDIARVNGIENIDKIEVGQKIYIPKFRYISNKENINAISS